MRWLQLRTAATPKWAPHRPLLKQAFKHQTFVTLDWLQHEGDRFATALGADTQFGRDAAL